MVFSSLSFLFFFLPVCILGYFCLRKNRPLANGFLFLCSLVFYAWGNARYVVLLLFSILFNWAAGRMLPRVKKGKRAILTATVAANLLILFVFKYLGFVCDNLSLLPGVQLPHVSLVLPIGISFFTFQALSYVVDVYRGEVEAQESIVCVGLYISFFPQLIAGPIVRYKDVEYQINHRTETADRFQAGVRRFLVGFSKKVLLANTLAVVADQAYTSAPVGQASLAFAWIGMLCYAMQIYFDFSGYSDMAIGLARMFGFEFRENFQDPYLARGMVDFWRRWHISLGTWFRDYVYIPLGGSRCSRMIANRNLLVVWLLTGIWHGADWTFLLWGLGHLAFILLEKNTRLGKAVFLKNRVLGTAATFFVVSLLWVLFRADNLAMAGAYYAALFHSPVSIGLLASEVLLMQTYWVYLAAAIAVCLLPAVAAGQGKVGQRIRYVLLWIAFLAALCYMIKGTYNPFIYFNF